MTTTEPQIAVHDELSIEPEAIIPPEEIHPAPAESWAKGREFVVYRVPSSDGTTVYTVTVNNRYATLYCTCPAAVKGSKPCRHLQAVLWKRAYEAAFRLYADLSLPELEERYRDFVGIERGAQVPTRAWRATVAAIGDLIRERTDNAA